MCVRTYSFLCLHMRVLSTYLIVFPIFPDQEVISAAVGKMDKDQRSAGFLTQFISIL